MKQMKNKDFVLLIASIVAFCVVMALLQGCASTKHKRDKQSSKLDAIKYKCDHSIALAGVPEEWSIKNFPVKTFTKTTTKYIKGKRDTVTVAGETVYADCSNAVTAALDEVAKKHVPVKCPDSRTITIHDTTVVADTTVVEDTRITESLRKSLSDTQEKLQTSQKQARNRLYWCFGLGALCLLFIGFFILLFTGKIR